MGNDFSELVKKHEPLHAQNKLIKAAKDFGEIGPLLVAFKNREEWIFTNAEAHELIDLHHQGERSRKKSKKRPELAKMCIELARFYYGYYGGEIPMYNTSSKGCCCLIASRNIWFAGHGIRSPESIKKDGKEFAESKEEDISRGVYTRLYQKKSVPRDCDFSQFHAATTLQKDIASGNLDYSAILLDGAIRHAISKGHLQADCEIHEFVRSYCSIERELNDVRLTMTNKPVTGHLEKYAKAEEFTPEEYIPGNPFPVSHPLHELLIFRL